MDYFKPVIWICVVLLAGCTTAGQYEGMKARHQLECQNQPSSEYEDGMKQADKTYRDYEAERETVEKGQ